MSDRPVGLLLAAGKSQRFGSNKLLHPVINNTSMLISSAQTLSSVLPGSIVVINQDLVAYTAQLETLGLHVVINEQAELGMGSSIACGVQASESAAGWLIALADMPYIKTQTITLLANKLRDGADIVAPLYDGQRGHPVGFSQHYKNALLTLTVDVGARNIINKHKDKLELLDVNDSGVIKDVDYAHELA